MNPQYDEWFDIESERIRVHRLRIIKEKQGLRETILSEMDTVVLGHYNDLDRLQRWADRLNLSTTAAALQSCLPTLIRAQSGHIGEILLTEIIPELFPDFIAPIKRLRWLDGRNMALRGEDYIGVDTTRTEPRFLKAESKSRANLITNVVTKARSALLENDGNPTTHAMLWVASRLEELNQSELADIFVAPRYFKWVQYERKVLPRQPPLASPWRAASQAKSQYLLLGLPAEAQRRRGF